MIKRLFLFVPLLIMCSVLVCSEISAQSTGQGVKLNNQGVQLFKKAKSADDYKRALEMYQEALRIYQRVNSAINEGITLGNIGNVYNELGGYEEALDYHERALEIKRKVRDTKAEGYTLNNIGQVHYMLGQYAKALDFYEKALDIAKRVRDAKLERVILGNIGVVYRERGDYKKASEYFDKALAIAKRTKDVQGEGVALGYMAAAYRQSGQYGKALEFNQQSIDMYKKVGDVNRPSQALHRIGNSLAQLGENEKGLENYNEALRLKKRLGVPVKEIQKDIGILYLDMGKMDLAELIFKEAEDAGGLGLLSLARGDYAQAKQHYEKHLKAAEQSRNVTDLFSAYTGLGKACEGLEEYKAAEEYYEKGMELTEEIRSRLMPAERKNFFEVKVDGFPRSEPAQGLTRVRMKINEAATSIDSSEVTRARTFSDNIAQKSEGGHAGIPKEILAKEDDLVSRVAALRKQLAAKSKAESPDRYENVNRQVQKAEADLMAFVEMLWEKHKAYASVKYPRPVALKEAATRPDEHIVIFDVVSEGVGVKLIKGKEITQTFYVKWNLADLEKDVKRFRQPFEQFKLREFDPELGNRLYKRLLLAALNEVPEGTPLVIIPDGTLALLPFEALVTGGKPVWKTGPSGEYLEGITYLGDQHPISYYQSITALTLVRTLAQQRKSGDRLLAMVDPVFSPDDERVKKISAEKRRALLDKLTNERLMSAKTQLDGLEFLRLPLTAELGRSLKEFDPDKTDLFEGLEARKSALLQRDLTPYSSIVFGTHGYFGTDLPAIQEPVLILTLLDQAEGQDGFLRLTEVMDLKMNCDMVALTACQSGLGRHISGEGMMGMGRAFQYAGAKSVLMSLWSVAESSSVDLVTSFFKHLRAGKNKLEALKLARDEIRKAGYDHPFFWAPFILVGEVD